MCRNCLNVTRKVIPDASHTTEEEQAGSRTPPVPSTVERSDPPPVDTSTEDSDDALPSRVNKYSGLWGLCNSI